MDSLNPLREEGRPTPAQPHTLELLVRGARCANCVARIESGVDALAGAGAARLNLTTGKLSVTAPGALSTGDIRNCVRALGYEAWDYDPRAVQESDEAEGRFLLTCLAIAGFGTVFVMGLTDAFYYGARDMGAATRAMLVWAQAFVAAPTVLFSARPFFRSALSSLRVRRANMDVPISLAIVSSLALSFYEAIIGGARTYFDAAVMLPFLLLIGRYLDFVVRRRAWNAANALVAMQAVDVRRMRGDGSVETVPARAIVEGDRILLAAGERTPVDGITRSGDTQADLSLVTGETAPQRIASGALLRAGSIVLGDVAVLEARAGVKDSLLAEISRLIEAGQQNRNRYVRLADRAASLYVPLVHGLAFAVFVAWLFLPDGGFATALRNAVSLLIVTCPCALGLAVPAVQVVATGLLFRRGLLVKSGDALERLAEVDTVVFDKTGTLTLGTPRLVADGGADARTLAKAATLARASRHPLAAALAASAGEGPAAVAVREYPGKGIECSESGGAIRLGSAAFIGAVSHESESSELWFRQGNGPPVRFAFTDALRPDAVDTLRALAAMGLAVEILSGDSKTVVESIAREAGVARWHAGVDPIAKTRRLEALKAQGRKVLMIGDGLNDAAALALAHVSIAPASAIDSAQAAADMVLQRPVLMPIADAIRVARKARILVLENFGFAIAYNAIAIPVAAVGLVTPLFAALAMASSSLIVTGNALRQSVRGSR